MMKIAIIGAGNIGSRLCYRWAKAGHEIWLGVRDTNSSDVAELVRRAEGAVTATTVHEAAGKADIITLAVGAKQLREVLLAMGPQPGKLIIETVNAAFDKAEHPEALIKELAGTTRIVKAFNTIGAEVLDQPEFGGIAADTFICGDDKEDKQTVTELARAIGFANVYDIGGIDKAPLLEQVALFWGSLAYNAGLGRNIAFKILKQP